MPERVLERPLDRLHWLVSGKPTANEFEDLGGTFNPHLHFVALLPSRTLPPNEAKKVQDYFDTMLEVLVPVRDSIAAYWLGGVMSNTPISDFSFEVQFRNPEVAGMVRKNLPRDLSSSVVITQRRQESFP